MQVCLFCGREHALDQVCATCLPSLSAGRTPATARTSAEAAASIEDARATQRATVLAEIRAAGLSGRTDDELQLRLGLDGSSERPRRWELWKLDLICPGRDAEGQVRRRRTRTARQAVVWVLPEYDHAC